MVGKNNKKLLELKSNPIIKKWRISRLKTGVASIVIFSGVLLSSTIFIPLHTVSAEETVTTTYYDQSKNVSDQLTNINISISNNKEKVIFPHNAESLTSNYAFKVPDSVNPKDYFYIDLSENANFYGVTEANSVTMPNLLAPDNSIIATGKYDIDTNRIQYEFTDYVAVHDNVSGKISLPIFIDPEVVTNTSYQTITASIGNSKKDLSLLVDYSKNVGPQYNANGAGNIFNVDLNNHNFSHTIYVNSLKQTLGNKSIEIRNQRKEENGYNSEIIYDKTNTQIKVYKVKSNGRLTDSFSIATNDSLEDVTNQCYIDFYDNKINISFPSNIDNETYVVQYTSPYTDKKDIATRVVMYGYSPYQLGNTSWYWDNYVKLTDGNASGDGSVISPDPETPVTPETPDPETPVTPETPDPETPVTPETPDPETPVTPETPDPETPVTPETPDPETPVTPETPDPETPVTPETPETPVTPDPETPVTPETPDPETPVTPETPDPETPVTPETPDPETPVTPETPDPETPVTPETPDPETPVTPETPDPETPVTPETPDPETPVTPETPDPETPVTPETPDPETPVTPETPDPETPVTPETPDPETPVTPETPDPETPVTPETPDPETPVTPETPDPETPVTPETPDPETPVTPETPDPETPVTPETPDPETPVTPETPDPETPVTPENPEPDKPVSLKNTNSKILISEKNVSNTNSKSNNTLPQTGEKESSGVLAGLVILLASIAVGIKLNLKRKNI
ncbi:Ig-like domain-containing protein [Enterococcus gallinarum]|uniref:Ig-like domain-containing protein n=1 Tax=Enterococcus gallinarum TaxID=1353 RepID=UPI0035C1F783